MLVYPLYKKIGIEKQFAGFRKVSDNKTKSGEYRHCLTWVFGFQGIEIYFDQYGLGKSLDALY